MSHAVKTKKIKSGTLPVLCGMFTLLVAVMIVTLCIPKERQFTPPPFEDAAVTGIPKADESLGYTELYRDGMAYRVSICGVPAVDGRNLTVYFTNTESNEKYLKLRILDEKDHILGETGLLKPNEYVKDVVLSKELEEGTQIKLKVMGYEPETYESAGSVSLNVTVGGKKK